MSPAFPSKQIRETVRLSFDFLDLIRFGEVVSSPEVTVSVGSGVDDAPSDILSGSPSISGTTVYQLIRAGMAGVTYVLSCSVQGSGGAEYVITKSFVILSDEGSFQPTSMPSLTGDLPDGVVGAAYSGTLDIAGGYAPYFPEDPTGSAPTWMAYEVETNTLICSGTPSADALASYTFTPRISDSAGSIATAPQTIALTRTLAAGDLGDQTFGATPSFSYTASLGTAPYTFSLVGGALPTGLSLNSDGSISGSCTEGGEFSWTIRATDVNNIPDDLDDTAEVSEPEWVYLSDPFGGGLGGSSTAPMIGAFGAAGALLMSAPRETGDPNPGSRFYYSTNYAVSFSSTFVAATLSATNTLLLYGNNIWVTMADRSTYTFNGVSHTYTAGAVSASWSGGVWVCGVWTGSAFICCSNGIDGMWSSPSGVGSTWTKIGANLPSGTANDTLAAIENIQGAGPNPAHGMTVGLRLGSTSNYVYSSNSGSSWATTVYSSSVPGTKTFMCSSKSSSRIVFVYHINNGASSGLEFVYTDDYGANFSSTFILFSDMPDSAYMLAGTKWTLLRSTNTWFIAVRQGGAGTETVILRMNEAMTSVTSEPIIGSPAPLANTPPNIIPMTSLDGVYAVYGWRRGASSLFVRRYP